MIICVLAIEMLIDLLKSTHDLTLRQAAKALANLGVNPDNKRLIAQSEGIPALISLLGTSVLPVKIEVVAALANLAVNGERFVRNIRFFTWVASNRLCICLSQMKMK